MNNPYKMVWQAYDYLLFILKKILFKNSILNQDYILQQFFKVVELVINKKRKEVLEKQLEDIGVPFKFFEVQQEDGPSQTQWTRLDGNNLSPFIH